MTRWEYLTEMPERRGVGLPDARLNELGTAGWELVTVVVQSEHATPRWVFKRPVTS